MKLSKEQLLQLSNIDSQYSQLEFLSRKSGIKLEELTELYHFGGLDLKQFENQNVSRQQVFEKSQTAKNGRLHN